MWSFLRKPWDWFFNNPSQVEKEAMLNVKLFYKKINKDSIKSSKPEKIIQKLLIEKDLVYCKEYSFKDLIGSKRPLRFDFAVIYKNRLTLIEYQGCQHYIYPNIYHKTKEEFDIQQERDKQKREYCKKYGIRLIEFDYLQDKILQELFNEYFP